jgi:hypothetical protein
MHVPHSFTAGQSIEFLHFATHHLGESHPLTPRIGNALQALRNLPAGEYPAGEPAFDEVRSCLWAAVDAMEAQT